MAPIRHARVVSVRDLAGEPPSGDLPDVTPDDPAYILYTSGSTGTPKGVLVPHRAIVNLVRNTPALRPDSDDVVSHLSDPCFDASTYEVWGALLNGARLVIFDRNDVINPQDLLRRFGECAVTSAFLTTSHFNLIARSEPSSFTGMRRVVFGGEKADPHATRLVLKHGKPERLINGYGPTECCVFSTAHVVDTLTEDAGTVPIGSPLTGTTVHVLDAEQKAVPGGTAGEIYIGGAGVALGYVNRPGLTGERFIPDPFSGNASDRLYRTGDMARWKEDGTLEYLGRLDNQVKIRGFRIEPGEVEVVLSCHPTVKHVAVTGRENSRAEVELVAYVVPDRSATSASELQDYLRSRLPEYMVPARFVFLPALPLTASLKIDYRRLPAPETASCTTRTPRTEVEHRLAAIWSELLDLDSIGIDDDVFELGAHSLVAMLALSRIREQFACKLSMQTIFEAPTIAEQASRMATDSSLA